MNQKNHNTRPNANLTFSFAVVIRSLFLVGLTLLILQPLAGQSNDALNIDQNGHVGIGTTTPGAQLHVSSTGVSDDQPAFRMGGNGRLAIDAPGKVGGRMMILKNGHVGFGMANPNFQVSLGTPGKSRQLALWDGGTSDFYGFGAVGSKLHFHAGTSSDQGAQMILDNTGNVGIGTTAPKGKLHVTGDIYAKGHMYLYSYEGDGKDGTAFIQARDDSGSSNIRMQFRTQKAGKTVDAMNIDSDGNIGIGTTTQKAKLEINGAVEMKELKINRKKPIILQRFKNINNQTNHNKGDLNNYDQTLHDTGYSSTTYSAAIVGYYASGYDVEENHRRQWSMRMERKNNTWHIRLITPSSYNDRNGTWEIDVLFIDKNMADIIGY